MARGRGKASPQDKEALRIISEKIRELLKEQGKKQIELSRITGIPASTLTGYVKGTSLPVPENLEKIAAFFQVAVAEIDPRLRNDFVVIDSEIERLYKQLDEANQENLLSYGKSLLTHQKERQKIEVTIPVKGNIIRSEQVSNDMYVSIDLVEEVIERQLKKYRTKLVTKQQNAAAVFKQDFLDEKSEDDEEIKIIRTKKFDMKPMYPEDACVEMELLGHDFYVFINAETEDVNVVYKRKGNTYGLIEPEY